MLSKDRCQFFYCSFREFTKSSHFVYATNPDLECTFITCHFFQISTTLAYNTLFIEKAAVGIIKGCCFRTIVSCHSYVTGLDYTWYLASASVNSTVCTNCRLDWSPYCGGSEELSFHHNNHSHLTSDGHRSCYCHIRTPKERDDICCFFLGTSCVGDYPIGLVSEVSGCIISLFNFINNSDSSGCIEVHYSNIRTIIRQTVFSFDSKSNSMKWISSTKSGSIIAIEDSFVVSSESIQEDTRVVMSNVERVHAASTHRQFQKRPHIALCGLNSGSFSGSDAIVLLLPFVSTTVTLILITARK